MARLLAIGGGKKNIDKHTAAWLLSKAKRKTLRIRVAHKNLSSPGVKGKTHWGGNRFQYTQRSCVLNAFLFPHVFFSFYLSPSLSLTSPLARLFFFLLPDRVITIILFVPQINGATREGNAWFGSVMAKSFLGHKLGLFCPWKIQRGARMLSGSKAYWRLTLTWMWSFYWLITLSNIHSSKMCLFPVDDFG